jgi:hypothetical protein
LLAFSIKCVTDWSERDVGKTALVTFLMHCHWPRRRSFGVIRSYS